MILCLRSHQQWEPIVLLLHSTGKQSKRIPFYGQTNVLCILLYILGRNDSEKNHMT